MLRQKTFLTLLAFSLMIHCKHQPSPLQSQGKEAQGQGASWTELLQKRCKNIKFDNREEIEINEDLVKECFESLASLNENERNEIVQAFLNPPKDEHKPEAALMAFIKKVQADALRIFEKAEKNRSYEASMATQFNKLFIDYREGNNEFGYKVDDIYQVFADKSSKYKMTVYLVGLMEAAQMLATAAGKEVPKIDREEEIAQAKKIVGLLAGEACLRGIGIKLIRLPTILSSFLDPSEKKCTSNEYTPWSKITINSLVDEEVKNIFSTPSKWSKNNAVVLLKNSPVGTPSYFDTRAAILMADPSLLHNSISTMLSASNIHFGDLARRKTAPYNFLWMWGFYDEPMGFWYSQYFKNQENSYVIIDKNVATKNHHQYSAETLLTMGDRLLGSTSPSNNLGAGMHRKGLIVDGKFMVMGGRNFGVEYSKLWRDTDILVAGPAAGQAGNLFAKTAKEAVLTRAGKKLNGSPYLESTLNDEKYNKPFYDKITGIDDIAFLDSSPSRKTYSGNIFEKPEEFMRNLNDRGFGLAHKSDGHDYILAAHIALIEKASKNSTVYIENAYFILTPPLKEAIEKAMDRGVNFYIHTNSANTSDEPAVTMPILLSVRELLELNAKNKPGKITVKLRQARYVRDAEEEITANPYVNLSQQDLLNSYKSLDHNIKTVTELRALTNLTDLTQESHPSTLHSKYMAVLANENGKNVGYALVTSYNLHPRSHRLEDEVAALIRTYQPENERSTYNQLSRWIKEDDPIAHQYAKNANLKSIELTNYKEIPIYQPQDWRNPRSLPTEIEKHGHWATINIGVILGMTLGFEEL